MKRSNNNRNNSLDLNKTYSQELDFKPSGLWYALNNEWCQWCTGNFDSWLGQNNFELDIDLSKVLVIKNSDDLMDFYNTYKKVSQGSSLIDYVALSERYSGIEIDNYHILKRTKEIPILERLWLLSWDISSGCIWDLSIINNYSLINNCTDDN